MDWTPGISVMRNRMTERGQYDGQPPPQYKSLIRSVGAPLLLASYACRAITLVL
jgi:hypothetical protein